MIRSRLIKILTPYKFQVTQWRCGRRLFKGKYYHIIPLFGMPGYWAQEERAGDQFITDIVVDYIIYEEE